MVMIVVNIPSPATTMTMASISQMEFVNVKLATLTLTVPSNAKVEVAAAASQLNRAESEVKALRAMTQNDINSEKMEEVVLKKCWLARYWGLVAKYDICADVAISKYELWSSLAPLPFEFVLSAGQKVKEKCWKKSLLRHRLAASSSSVLFITVTAVRFCCCRILPLLLPPLLLPYSFWRWCSGDVTCPCYNLQG